jgi:hypothetical protein
MIRVLVLFVAVYLALVVQEFLPPLGFLDGARLLLVPVLFCYGALWLPFPAMLVFALYTGLLSDLAALRVLDDRVEIGLGWSMVFYVLLGAALNTLRRTFPAGRWEIHCLASAVITFLLLLGTYLMISLRRDTFFHFDATVLWHLVGPSLAALLVAPLIFLLLHLVPAGFLGTSAIRTGSRL